MNYTSIEQSKKLLELGLSPESADMCYLPTHLGDEHHWISSLSSYSECTKMTDVSIDYCIPCWSLSSLLELMPKDIVPHWASKPLFHPIISFNYCKWRCAYVNELNSNHAYGPDASGNTLIEAAYNMVLCLLENGYIKTK